MVLRPDEADDGGLVRERCDRCPRTVTGRPTATGHVVGARYVSAEYEAVYRVERACTLWDLAPGAAVRRVWVNGNITVSEAPRGADSLICDSCFASGPGEALTRAAARAVA